MDTQSNKGRAIVSAGLVLLVALGGVIFAVLSDGSADAPVAPTEALPGPEVVPADSGAGIVGLVRFLLMVSGGIMVVLAMSVGLLFILSRRRE